MKNFILFCFFVSNTSLVYSQTTFNRAYHDVNEKTNPFVIEINGNIFHTTTNIDVGAFGLNNFYCHSNTGNLNFKQTLPFPSEPKLGFKSLDNKIVMLGGSMVCDVGDGTQTNYLAKYNVNGTAVFQTTYTASYNNRPVACIQAADSSYYTFTDSLMIKINKSGQINFKMSTGFGSISSALLLPSNQILLSAKSGSFCSFVILALTGTVVNVVSTPTLYTQLAFYGNQKIIARGIDAQFYKFTQGLNFINSSNWSNGQSLYRFVNSNDTLHCLLNSSLTVSSYGVCDTSFNFFSNTTSTTNKVEQIAITLTSNNKVAIISECVAHASANFGLTQSSVHRQTNLSVINKLGANNFNHDLAILSMSNDSTYSVCPSSPFGTPPCTVYLRAKVKIKNVGATTITSFKLNCFERWGVACGDFFYQQQFSQLNLNPNDTITVITNRFIMKDNITPTSSITQVPFCFYVSVPNNEVDKTLQDNELCKSFSFITTGLKENVKLESEIKIFPNPFNLELKIESSEIIINYKLFDVLGKLVQEGNSENKILNLKTENLKPGIYFIQIQTKLGVETKKVLKD